MSRIEGLKEIPKAFKKRPKLEDVQCAARRMVVFEKWSDGLVVEGVSRFGNGLEVETAFGDWGLRLKGERAPVLEEPKS
jgi:hypothetical protein